MEEANEEMKADFENLVEKYQDYLEQKQSIAGEEKRNEMEVEEVTG